ncbi:halogenase [Dictyobacter sp. S3.2.2.5]|uniref:Halogenase n=1 Tax=Dictyobacter halimunensis TaxID=3026934 RepID=A0ABQ6FIH6_9CHLR|nr:halogenase [Dictyobacter sp. S3.2.2.5]
MTEYQVAQEEASSMASPDQYDVAILGGGIAGLSLAIELKKSNPAIRMLVVEKQKHPVPEAAHKVGESTVEVAAHYLRDVLGLKEHLDEQQLPKFGLRLFFSAGDNQDITRRVELGHAVLPPRRVATYQLDRGRLENALGLLLTQEGIPFLDTCKVQQIILQPQEEVHRVLIQQGTRTREIQARWIVDASGRNTLLQRQLGLAKKVGHEANAVWFRIGYPIDINTWSDDPAWQGRIREGRRALSTNHLMGPGYWIWLIPLSSGSTSVGIVTDARMHNFDEMNLFERALKWLHRHEPQCAAVIEQQRAAVQDFRVMKNYSYSCEQVFSDERWCLVGEAGVSLDPLYSPGGDLIAIANGLACDLISHALEGEDIEERAAIHNQLFLLLTNSWRSTYEQQYPIMGNAQIMAAKVIWDTAVYWAVPGLLYFHDKLRRIADSPAVLMNLARFATLSEHVQAFLRQWHAIARSNATDTFISYYDFDFMARLQIGMTAGLADAELEAQFAANVRFLEQLAGQLVSCVIDELGDGEDEEVRRQIERWQADPFLTELMAVYRQENQEHPINSGWITLGRQRRERQEVAG